MNFHTSSKKSLEINLTPLIDVVFLLLIFFMVSTTFTRETQLRVELPEAVANPSEMVDNELVILIEADGSYAVNGERLARRDIDTLLEAIRSRQSGDPNQRIVITADAATRHENVVRAMDATGRLGLSNLTITTQAPEAEQEP